MTLQRRDIATIAIDHRGNVAGGFNNESVAYQLRNKRQTQDNHTRRVQDTFESAPYMPLPRNKNHIYWKELEEVLPQKIKLAKELQTMFRPVNQYNSWNHKTKIYDTYKCLDNPLNIIKNAYNMKVDTSLYQKNRNYFSNLYQSLKNAQISHSDILAVWGNPYINAATNWNIMLYQKQQSIRNQYPGIDNVAKSISSIKYDFANVLSKTTPEMRQFVNDFAIPVTTISSMYKGAPSPLSKSSDAITAYLYKIADGFNRAMIPGYSAYADGGSVEEIVTSAGSDLILTYCGGKAIKIGYQGLKYAGAKFSFVLKPKTTKVTWGMWSDLPKTMYKGKEYAKIGKYYYTQHAIEHMSFGALKSKIPSSQVGKEGLDMRRIPSMVVEEVIKYGKKSNKFYEGGEWRLSHILGNVKIITTADSKVVVTAMKIPE